MSDKKIVDLGTVRTNIDEGKSLKDALTLAQMSASECKEEERSRLLAEVQQYSKDDIEHLLSEIITIIQEPGLRDQKANIRNIGIFLTLMASNPNLDADLMQGIVNASFGLFGVANNINNKGQAAYSLIDLHETLAEIAKQPSAQNLQVWKEITILTYMLTFEQDAQNISNMNEDQLIDQASVIFLHQGNMLFPKWKDYTRSINNRHKTHMPIIVQDHFGASGWGRIDLDRF